MEMLKSYRDKISSVGIKKAETTEESAMQDAYLKRFASVQDYLGSKIFPLLAETAGLPGIKMTDILDNLETEGVIESVESWAGLRALRNELEHDYPEVPEIGQKMLAQAIEHYKTLESIYKQSIEFAGRFS